VLSRDGYPVKPDTASTHSRPVYRWRRGGLLLGLAVALALVVGAGWLCYLAPVRTAGGHLAAAYPGERAPRDIQFSVSRQGLTAATVRVVARFAADPDYGTASPAPADMIYTADIKLARQGLVWTPVRGFSVDGRVFGVFNGAWTVADPELEAARRAAEPCG